jgi:hypothetical protein
MQLTVSGCIDCPLCSINFNLDYFCSHPNFDENALIIKTNEKEDPITPKECPLNDFPIMIKRKEWQHFEDFWNRQN